MKRAGLFCSLVAIVIASQSSSVSARKFARPLPVEPLMKIEVLPDPLPDAWVVMAMMGSKKIEVLNPALPADSSVRGSMGAENLSNILYSPRKKEFYVTETFFSRGTRGSRTDTLTVYDSRTLLPKDELVLPDNKRALAIPQWNAFQFTNSERWGLVFNFTPAASVSVIDLDERKILNDVQIPGCALVYPMFERGFATLCANGSLLSIKLDDAGQVIQQTESEPFNDLDNDALFAISATVGSTSYFVSFLGNVQAIDYSGADPKILPKWSMLKGVDTNSQWRPSGYQMLAAGSDGLLYVIMRPDGHEGSHMRGGQSVWVIDPKTQARVKEIKLERLANAIAVSEGANRLLATGPDAKLDSYDVATGALVESLPINSFGAAALIYPVRKR